MLPVSFTHLERLMDDTGLLEHCFEKIPRRKEGYSTDDNARALWACVEWIRYAARTNENEIVPVLQALADKYLEFLMWVQEDDGHFHNNVRYDRSFEAEAPSDDCQGRTLWALANAILFYPERQHLAPYQMVCYRGFQFASALKYPRGIAHALSAACILLRALNTEETMADDWFTDWVRRDLPVLARRFTQILCDLYEKNHRPGWHWFEPVMTYANAVLPWALLHSYAVFKDNHTLRIAEASLAFLTERMTTAEGHIRPVGNKGWATPSHASIWDQQPLEVMKLALASATAIQVIDDRTNRYRRTLEQCVAWFHGANDCGLALVDDTDGGCCDGLKEDGLNTNQGAESTLSYLITEAIYHNTLAQGGSF